MAAVSVTFDGTRVNNADGLGSVWTDLGGGKCASEPDFIYQGSAAVSEKVGTSAGGVAADISGEATSSYDMTTPQVWIAKVIATNSSALNNKGATGGILEIGSGGRRTNYDRYYVVGGDTYPIKGGWLIIPIDPNGGNQSARPGTAPTLSAIDFFGWECTFGATSKAENVAMDAIDIVSNGSGLTLTGGDGADADGTFDSFVTTDEGSPTTGRWGIVTTQDGILYVTGVLTIGSATATVFTDANQVLTFPEAEFLNTVGFFGVDFGLQNATNVITIDNTVFKSQGTSGGTVDTRPDYTVTGTSGTLALDGCNFNVFRLWTATSACTIDNTSFVAGDQLITGGADIDSCTFDSLTNASQVVTSSPANAALITNSTFISPGTGNGLEIGGTAANITLTGLDFSGYDTANPGTAANKAIYVNIASGSMTITISGGSGVTADHHVRTAGATVTVNSDVSVTFTGLKDNTEVRIYSAGTSTELAGVENATAGTTDNRSFTAAIASSTSVDYTLVNNLYEIIRVEGFTWPSADQDIAIQQRLDRNYSNP